MHEIISIHWTLFAKILVIAPMIVSLIAHFVIYHIMDMKFDPCASITGYYFKRSFKDLSRKEHIIVNISYFVMIIGVLVPLVTVIVLAL